MVRPALALALLTQMAFASTPAAADVSVDLAAWAAALPTAFAAHGVKTEPTYEASIDIARQGDVITVTGGAPAWAARAREVARVTEAGALCLDAGPCAAEGSTSGFLATAGLIAAARRHALSGSAPVVAFGDRQVVCVAGERLGIAGPILDPCFDRLSGAAIAERHRLTGAFDGPTLDPASLRIAIPPAAVAAPQRFSP